MSAETLFIAEYLLRPRTLAPQRVAGSEVEEAFLAHVTHSARVTVNIILAHTLARHSVTITRSSHCAVSVAITSCIAQEFALVPLATQTTQTTQVSLCT